MKRITRAFVIATLVSAATAATAADSPFPSSAQDVVPLSQEFPNMDTYTKAHHDSAMHQAPLAYPSGGRENYSQTMIFSGVVTYADQHVNDAVQVSSTPTFPSSTEQETPLSSEFPNIVTYKRLHRNDSMAAVRATR